MKRAIEDYRVLLLDQRGTGRSTPVGPEIPGSSPDEQARYLTHFRADSIVRDAEHIRRELGVERWSVLGQSFGGFTSMTYLSLAPEGLRAALITGGLSPVGRPPDDVYRATSVRLIEKNRAYFERYPGDRARVAEILARLEAEDVRLPSGDRLTARRFRQLGMWLGDSAGWELLHHVVELPFGSPAFLYDAEAGVAVGAEPDLRHAPRVEYADGFPTRWSAARVLPAEVEERRYFTAEQVFPWMWDDYGRLRPHRARGGDPRRARMAEALRRGPSPPQRRPGRGDDLRRRRVRRSRLRDGDRRPDQGPAPVDHERVRAQRLARRR